MSEDMKEFVMKGACEEQDAINNRRFKVAKLLEKIDYGDDKEREICINSFTKSNMSLEDVSKYADHVLSSSIRKDVKKIPMAGVQ